MVDVLALYRDEGIVLFLPGVGILAAGLDAGVDHFQYLQEVGDECAPLSYLFEDNLIDRMGLGQVGDVDIDTVFALDLADVFLTGLCRGKVDIGVAQDGQHMAVMVEQGAVFARAQALLHGDQPLQEIIERCGAQGIAHGDVDGAQVWRQGMEHGEEQPLLREDDHGLLRVEGLALFFHPVLQHLPRPLGLAYLQCDGGDVDVLGRADALGQFFGEGGTEHRRLAILTEEVPGFL